MTITITKRSLLIFICGFGLTLGAIALLHVWPHVSAYWSDIQPMCSIRCTRLGAHLLGWPLAPATLNGCLAVWLFRKRK